VVIWPPVTKPRPPTPKQRQALEEQRAKERHGELDRVLKRIVAVQAEGFRQRDRERQTGERS
jgi:hypothetical protein